MSKEEVQRNERRRKSFLSSKIPKVFRLLNQRIIVIEHKNILIFYMFFHEVYSSIRKHMYAIPNYHIFSLRLTCAFQTLMEYIITVKCFRREELERPLRLKIMSSIFVQFPSSYLEILIFNCYPSVIKEDESDHGNIVNHTS